ncbi:Phosphotransferase enzyme family protein [Parafrankia irregularis]|uniref:Phosphotransferase enzyme family protein n=1 Tax=Parafrankia irregularis TaxID=795642 RepID=A0A0S4QQI7_9ACTN|nr:MULTISPECIES: aminoglycoside phosphotransferase family protein [Parafrankia]MBE3204442.1 aminoglycoside phosphotransferase family protein [Parafrankia sp. CH37]CUU57715.1 Phosphotransferase enzyme family protein [Parafrankia irregularis]
MQRPERSDGRFTAARSRQALHRVCASVGIDDRDAEPIKLTVNAVYRLPHAAAIVRIATSSAMHHRVEKVVQVAHWLADHGMPAVRLLPGVPAPVRVDDYVATIWCDVGAGDADPRDANPVDAGRGDANPGAVRSAHALATILRRLHALEPPEPPLPSWDPLDDVRRRLDDAEGLAPRDRTFLEGLFSRVEEALGAVRYELPRSVIHGDAHLGNLIRSASGEIVICDFDATCHGPAEWDLVPVALGPLRFGRPPAASAELARAYGFDVTAWDGFPALRAVRELKLVTSVVPMLASRPSAAAQFAVRLDSLRSGADHAVWALYR